MSRPETCHAWNGDVRIAYQIVGDGPLDLIVVPGLVSHLDLIWDNPEHAWFCAALAQHARLILFDKRGTGLSDRDKGAPGLEDRMDDMRTVLDAAGARRPAIFGDSEGGMMSLLFVATYPERVRALALYGAFVHSPTRDWPAGQIEARFDLVERAWGSAAVPPTVAPSKAADQEFRRAWARFERESASAATAAALLRIDRDIDISPALPAVRVPTLLLHRVGDRRINIANGRYLAERLPSATYVELPGTDHLPYVGDAARVVAEVAHFLAGLPEAAAPERAFATVLSLTSDAPARLAAIGAPEIARFGGRALGVADGEVAVAFDGPARAIRCGLAICERAEQASIAACGGLHSGDIALESDPGEVWRVARYCADAAGSGEILVSRAVRDLVAGAGLRFTERSRQSVPGLPEGDALYAASIG